jgi:flavodoxin/NAD-dependent dihydropyrimidine dehydrogenase PreA subunit
MKAAIIYYSNTGNTKMICNYIKNKVKNVDFELIDMIHDGINSIVEYDLVGFAFFADAMKPSKIFLDYVKQLNDVEGKYAFIINTYGFIGGKSAKIMYNAIKERGITVIGMHSIHTPENYPPMILQGRGFTDHPNEKEKRELNEFLLHLDDLISNIRNHKAVIEVKPKLRFIDAIMPGNIDFFSGFITGEVKMHVDKSKCKKCGICVKVCPVHAISLQKEIAINNSVCQKCWSCYNHCPGKAIYTGKYTGEGQYPKPIDEYVSKWN